MYTGQIAVITTQDDWVSDFYQITDEDTGEVVNISNPDIGFGVTVKISDREGCGRTRSRDPRHGCSRSSIDLPSGNVFIADADNGPGIQWVFPHSKLSCLCSGTYKCTVVVTVNGLQTTLLDADLVVEKIP